MKNKIVILIAFFFFIISNVTGQVFESDPHRGFYVDKFCTRQGNTVISALSILGNQAKEDSLLRFAQKYHFTYIVLYDLGRIFGNTTLENQLCSFMARAKNNYCITQIGAVVGGDPCALFDCTNLAPPQLPQSISPLLPSRIQSLASANLPSTDPNYWLSENIKLALHAFVFGGGCQPAQGIPAFDVFSIESEFWGVGTAAQNLAAYNQFLIYLDDLAQIRNSFNPSAIIEVYLAAYTNSTVQGKTIDQITDDIESIPTPYATKRADRILMTYYKPYLDSTIQNGVTDNYWIYSNSGSHNTIPNVGDATYDRQTSFRRSTTSPQTDFHPLFSAESIYNAGESNFQGAWLNKRRRNNIFIAEKKYYDQWRTDGTINHSSTDDNAITPGGVMWFASSFLAGQFSAPTISLPVIKLFVSNSPVATTGTSTAVNFAYIGPIEKDIQYEFTILDKETCTPITTTGLPASGTTGNYIPENVVASSNPPYSTTISLPSITLQTGTYIARIKLVYDNCPEPTYYEEEVKVVNSPTIVSLEPTTQCEGNQVTLLSSTNSSSAITWYKVGNSSPITPTPTRIAKNYELVVTESGTYYACIGSCSGTGLNGKTNFIDVELTPIEPPIVTTTGCGLNGNVQFDMPAGATNYIWQNNNVTSFIISPPVSTRTIYKYAYVKNGCFKSGSLSFNSDLFNTSVASPTISTSPTSLTCGSQVNISASCPTCGNYTNRQYAWSNKLGSDASIEFNPINDNQQIKIWHRASNGCRTMSSLSVGITNTIQTSFISNINNACGNGNSITLSSIPSFTPSTISWSGPASYSSPQQNPPTIINSSASNTGIYIVSASDGSCTAERVLNVTGISIPFTVPIEISNNYCNATAILSAGCATNYSSYSWSDGQTLNPIAVPASGTYIVTVTDANGCTSSSSINVTIPGLPTVTISGNPSLPVCFGTTLNLTTAGLNGTSPYSYDWTGPNSFASTSVVISLAINSTSGGDYLVTVTDYNGCTSSTSTTVVVDGPFSASTTSTPSTCLTSADGTATVSNPSGGLQPYTYHWHFNNSTSNSISGLLPGNYLVDVIDNVPCTTTVTVNVPFTNPAIVANAGADQIICANSSIILSGNIPTFGNGTWSIISGAGGNIAQPTNPSSSFSGVNGTAYTLRWTVSGSPCPSASDNVQIIIRPVITPSVSISQTVGTNPMCAGASATFTATPTNGGTLPSFQWKINAGNVGTNSPIFTTTLLTNGQTVTCVMTSNATCVSTTPVPSNSITITVTPFILLDLFMKDNTIPPSSVEDDGTEPSPFTLIMANSQDIWVTVGNNPWVGAQNADFDQNPNHVWVTVRNRGCVDYTSGAQLHIYWAKASTALDWDSYWTADPVTGICHQTPASNGLTCGSSADCLGEEITDPVNGIPIPPIAAKSSTGLNPISTLWTVPNSNGFQSCMPLAYEHFCLVARIVYPTQDPMTFPEGSNIWSNTWQNNNIIWRNITIVSTIPGIQSGGNECIGDKPVGGVISVGNPFEDADVYQLDFKVDDNYTGLPIFEQAEIKVTLDEKTWDIWAAGGFQSDNFSIKREDCRQLVVTGSPATLKNLAYDRNDLSLIALSFNFLTDKVDQTPNFLYHVIQVRNENNDEIIGSETYQIGKPSRYLFGADGGGDKTISYTENIQLSASVIGEPAFYNWYDEEGNMIYTGENFTVSPEFTKKYKLEVIAQSDGFTSYDSVIVHVKEYEIINLSPNPASSQLTVEYEARKANSAYFTIVQPYTTTINNYIINPTLTTTTLNLSGYTPGNYFIRLICDGQIRDEKTLIIIQ